MQGFLFAASYLGKSNFWLLVQQALMKLLGKFHFQGFFVASSYWGSPTLGVFFVTSSWESCICSVFLRNILLGNCWDSVFFCSNPLGNSHLWIVLLQQAIGEEPFLALLLFQAVGEFPLAGLLLHRSSSGIPNCLRFARSYSRISIANCCLLQAIEGLRFRIIIYILNLTAPSCGDSGSSYILNTAPHLAIPVHHIS